MSRGGKRPGAGKPKGSLSKVTKTQITKAASAGEMPVDFMLRLMRNEVLDLEFRAEMAKAAAPYLHHRLAPIDKLPSKPDVPGDGGDDDDMLPDFSALVRQR